MTIETAIVVAKFEKTLLEEKERSMRQLSTEEKLAILTGLFYKSNISKEATKNLGIDIGDLRIDEVSPKEITFEGVDKVVAQKIFDNKILVED